MKNKIETRRSFIKKCSAIVAGTILAPYVFSAKTGNNISKIMNNNSFSQNQITEKEALFYKKVTNGIECELCPNFCLLREGRLSSCRTRIVKNGKLMTLAYNNPCALHIDPIEKKPLYHFQPASKTFSLATAGCNLHCLNCQNWNISQVSPTETKNTYLTSEDVIKTALGSNCQSISYTYTEPIVFYEYMHDISILAHKAGLKNIMVTAGYINEKPLKKICKYIDAANIDLKSFDNDIYKRLNAGALNTVLNTLKTMKDEGLWIEITNLIIPTWNDDSDMISRMCDWLLKNGFENYPIHFSRFYPTYKLTQIPPTPVSTMENAAQIALKAGIKYVFVGNVPGSAYSNTICHSCKKTIISRVGYSVGQININDGKCKFCNAPVHGVWQ